MGSTPRARFSRLTLGAKAGVGIAVAAGVLGVAAAVPAVADAVVDGGDQVVVAPTGEPTAEPTAVPTAEPTVEPTTVPAEEPSVEAGAEEAVEADVADAPGADSFGAWVSEQAKDGGVDGQAISEAAHQRNDERRAAKAAASLDKPKPSHDK